ncbi:MAG: hypothetical protein MHMPM18_003642, partial [Marteilia pararefringens]
KKNRNRLIFSTPENGTIKKLLKKLRKYDAEEVGKSRKKISVVKAGVHFSIEQLVYKAYALPGKMNSTVYMNVLLCIFYKIAGDSQQANSFKIILNQLLRVSFANLKKEEYVEIYMRSMILINFFALARIRSVRELLRSLLRDNKVLSIVEIYRKIISMKSKSPGLVNVRICNLYSQLIRMNCDSVYFAKISEIFRKEISQILSIDIHDHEKSEEDFDIRELNKVSFNNPDFIYSDYIDTQLECKTSNRLPLIRMSHKYTSLVNKTIEGRYVDRNKVFAEYDPAKRVKDIQIDKISAFRESIYPNGINETEKKKKNSKDLKINIGVREKVSKREIILEPMEHQSPSPTSDRTERLEENHNMESSEKFRERNEGDSTLGELTLTSIGQLDISEDDRPGFRF